MIRTLFALCVLLPPSTVNAVVIRHDVDDSKYLTSASEYPAVVDLPREGHGVLVSPDWVLSAAHAVEPCLSEVVIAGVARKVKGVVFHPGYRMLPTELAEAAVASGNPSDVMEFLERSDDVALVELALPATDVMPIALYRGDQEIGLIVSIVGKGATGNGAVGQEPGAPHRTVMRHATNTIVGADSRWLSYVFDEPPLGLPLEGIIGSGDSGGPVFLITNGRTELVGLASWSRYTPTSERSLRPGLYGQVVYSVRLSRYSAWIESIVSQPTTKRQCEAQSWPRSFEQLSPLG